MKALLVVALFIAGSVHAKIATKEIRYQVDGKDFVGFVAWDAAKAGKRPGVLVVHEWWGHNDYARGRAKQLAELGYTALALDMYGGGAQAEHPKKAGEMSGWVSKHMDEAEKRFRAAMMELKNQPTVDADRIGAIGYCFGGGMVLNMARRGVPLKAVASFHGSLGTETPAKKGEVKTHILVANGADDPFVSKEAIETFKKEMDAAGVDYQFINYPKAVHGFTNPDATKKGKKYKLPLAYNKAADRKSWEEMKKLFRKHL